MKKIMLSFFIMFLYVCFAKEIIVKNVKMLKKELSKKYDTKTTILIKEGKYVLSEVIPENVNLKGIGKVIFEPKSNFVLKTSKNQKIENLTFLLKNNSQDAICLINSVNITISNVKIVGTREKKSFAIIVKNSKNIILENVSIQNCEYGIFIKDSANFEIKNCIIKNNLFCGIYLINSKGKIKNNIIKGNGDYGIFSDDTYEYFKRLFAKKYYIIENNTVENHNIENYHNLIIKEVNK